MAATTPRRLRIAALCCFTFPEHIAHERGQFDDIFAAWIYAAADARNKKKPTSEQVVVELKGWDIVSKGQYPDLDDIDALIITGSASSAYENEPWIHQLSNFIRDVYENHSHLRIYGGCFGHQLISQALLSSYGLSVQKNPKGWEVGVHSVSLSTEFSSKFPQLLKDGSLSYQFLHQDQVVMKGATLPSNWIQMGTSPLCEVQGLLEPGRVLTFQGHPEFDRFVSGSSAAALVGLGLIPGQDLQGFLDLVDQDDMAGLAGEVALDFLCQPAV